MWLFPTSWRRALKVVYMSGCFVYFMVYIALLYEEANTYIIFWLDSVG